ncbi:zinc transporter 7-like [Ananas comosus]|uniref:Zinc transporter 7-like n=1 Tax=Ananas comosus TaxID=4615 RepID=A0A6P5FA79_ANACO|nr:zinc transporter 7-like [Ananas comosus]
MVGVAIPLAAEEEEGCRDDAPALRLKLAAMAAILVSGMVGVAIPLAAGRKRRRLLSTESGFFALAKAFAAGVILATGFIHMLHDAEAALTDPCLPRFPWRRFPFSGFVAMAAALATLATLVLDFLATQFYERSEGRRGALHHNGGAGATRGRGRGRGLRQGRQRGAHRRDEHARGGTRPQPLPGIY